MKKDKLAMRTPNLADEKFAALAKLFPNAVTEAVDENGVTVRAVDADALAREINTAVLSGTEERYQFTWPEKRDSVVLANAPLAAALRPCREESVDFDNTENLYIEGDNLDVLKLLRETYLNRVKMIFIDPPYNTGNDFIYDDDFSESAGEYAERSGDYDDLGNRLVRNLDRNGRFHTDWLNMMYPRLRVARDLMAEDGVIFISIDDNEAANLKKMCDEIWGARNFVAQLVWEKVHTRKNSALYYSVSHDYILCYAKHKRSKSTESTGWKRNLLPRENTAAYKNPDNDPKGPWKTDPITAHNYYGADYTIRKPNGVVLERPQDRYWAYSEESWNEKVRNNEVVWGEGSSYPLVKRYLSEVQDGLVPVTIFSRTFAGDSSSAKKELDEIFDGNSYFDYPKPSSLIKRLLQISTSGAGEDIILDFFSGSATTAHAVMQLNAEDGGRRKFIMVQLPELCEEERDAFKAGYKNICEIGKERMRRAGARIKREKGLAALTLDIGFRVLKLDSSNMKDVYYTPAQLAARGFDFVDFVDNIKSERTSEDLLFQVMLDLGIPLSAKIEVDGRFVRVNGNYLVACFAEVDAELLTTIAKLKPYYAVFRDQGFRDDSTLVNFEQVFNTYSPRTIRKVL